VKSRSYKTKNIIKPIMILDRFQSGYHCFNQMVIPNGTQIIHKIRDFILGEYTLNDAPVFIQISG
jgi:hypothetical protein